MKKVSLIFLFSILVICPLNAIREDEPHDAYWWNKYSDSFKLGYVEGITQGYLHCYVIIQTLLELYQDSISLSEYQDIMLRSDTCSKLLYYSVTGMTYGQMIAGIDQFYKDYRNRKITIEDVLYLVRMEIDGKSDAEIDSVTRKFRSGK